MNWEDVLHTGTEYDILFAVSGLEGQIPHGGEPEGRASFREFRFSCCGMMAGR